MHDVTWRTVCTFAILAFLVLLGSGGFQEAPNPVPTPLPTGEGTRSASYGAGPSTPEAGAALPAGYAGAPSPGAASDAPRLAISVLQVPRQSGWHAEVWR
ncbi:MAG TPA: hypothetical protein VLC52_07780 [Anaerolineae bacterium]|nr:hypothetical protein [Anaerolineae bacterium]